MPDENIDPTYQYTRRPKNVSTAAPASRKPLAAKVAAPAPGQSAGISIPERVIFFAILIAELWVLLQQIGILVVLLTLAAANTAGPAVIVGMTGFFVVIVLVYVSCLVVAYNAYRQLLVNAAGATRMRMYVFLMLPVLVPMLFYVFGSMMGGGI
jgi:hypothetical protein